MQNYKILEYHMEESLDYLGNNNDLEDTSLKA
jgi:hypothetical protein